MSQVLPVAMDPSTGSSTRIAAPGRNGGGPAEVPESGRRAANCRRRLHVGRCTLLQLTAMALDPESTSALPRAAAALQPQRAGYLSSLSSPRRTRCSGSPFADWFRRRRPGHCDTRRSRPGRQGAPPSIETTANFAFPRGHMPTQTSLLASERDGSVARFPAVVRNVVRLDFFLYQGWRGRGI
jgi:hypothetical protein